MQVFCVACGAKVMVPPGRARSRLRCPRCGKILPPPAEGGAIGPTESAASGDLVAGEAEASDHVGFDFSNIRAERSAAARPAAAARERPWHALTVVAAFLGGAAVVAIGVALRSRTSPPTAPPVQPPAAVVVDGSSAARPSAAPALLSQKQAADALALAGRLQEAYAAYGTLLRTIAAGASRDPLVLSVAAGARSAQDQVFAALLHQRVMGAAPPTSAPAEAAAPPTTPSPASQPAAEAATALAPPTVVQLPAAPATAPSTMPATAPSFATAAAPVEPPTDTAPEPPPAPRPPIAMRTYTLPGAVTDEQIGRAIHAGVMFLQRAFHNGELRTIAGRQPNQDNAYGGAFTNAGVDTLCAYALLHAGQANGEKWLGIDSPFTRQMLAAIKSYDFETTYNRSLRAAALAVYARPEDRAALEADVDWLIRASIDGGYTYRMVAPSIMPTFSPPTRGTSMSNPMGGSGSISIGNAPVAMGQTQMINGVPVTNDIWDNSNSQYGLLGVWAGAQVGVSVPAAYWTAVERHWNNCQLPDGQWGYQAGGSGYLSMTDAGVASLLVTRDYLDQPGGGPTYSFETAPDHGGGPPALQRGLDWLDAGDNAVPGQDVAWSGYVLYGVERVGLASGYKYFGTHDWYAELAKRLIAIQHADGAWGDMPPTIDTAITTAYSLLFLSRGRHPILYNKLRFDGFWDTRRHDIENLAAFATHELERPINWQVVNLAHDWPDWMDSPVLYIASDEPPRFSQRDLEKLRGFALGGGLIFTHADAGSVAVNDWVQKFARALFPQFPLENLPASHPLYSVLYPLNPAPRLWAVSNGSRLLLVHSPIDLAGMWELKWSQTGKAAYQLGLNIFLYGAGKGDLRNRLQSPFIPEWPGMINRVVPVARLRYGGNWDPEPYAWTRLDRYLGWEAQEAVAVKTVDLASLQPGEAPLADLTGAGPHTFTDAEIAATRAFVAAGGVLLIDAAGGSREFADDARLLLSRAFHAAPLLPLPPNHPMLLANRAGADDLSHPLLRPYAMERLGAALRVQGLRFGKGEVIFTPLDLTTGLLGTNTWGIVGYDPAYAAALVKNAVLWADARQAGATTAPSAAGEP